MSNLSLMKLCLSIILFFSTIVASAQSTLQKSFIHNGIIRYYRIYIPASYTGTTPVPLLLNLHGYTSNSAQQLVYAEFRPIADTANFIMVLPDGTSDLSGNQYWNTFNYSTVNDLGFIAALLDTMNNRYSIDLNRVYSTGLSNGGIMSYELACFLNNRVAAIASVAGTMAYSHLNSCNPSHPTPVMEIHGTNDPTVPYNGSSAMVATDSLLKFWINYNNCNPIPTTTQIPNINAADNCTSERHVYNNGDLGSAVELYKIIDGGHSWPGAIVNLNTTNMDISASKEIWRFFRPYRLNQLTSVKQKNVNKPSLYPNPFNEQFTLSGQASENFKTVTITDIQGRIYKTLSMQETEIRFDTSTWPSGIYIISMQSDKDVQRAKILKR